MRRLKGGKGEGHRAKGGGGRWRDLREEVHSGGSLCRHCLAIAPGQSEESSNHLTNQSEKPSKRNVFCYACFVISLTLSAFIRWGNAVCSILLC